MNELAKSPVTFHEENHTYDMDGIMFKGVTPIIAWLFPETYKGIPQSVLNAAADYGTMIHKKCELADGMGIVDHPSVQAYKELMEQKGLKVLASEYLVSDALWGIASSIDKVMENYDLGDIKTTSKVHIPNVTMQLSIYAWMFEQQNPDKKAGKLYCIWLPKPEYGTADIIELKRVSPEIVRQVIDIWAKGGDYEVARALLAETGFEFEKQRMTGDIPDEFGALVGELEHIKQALDELGEREKAIKAEVLRLMQESGADKWTGDSIEFVRKAAYERTSIDTTKLKKEQPEVFESYKKVTKVAESVTYKIF